MRAAPVVPHPALSVYCRDCICMLPPPTQTRPLNVDAKELPALTERLAGTVGLTPLCRHRVGDDPDERPRRYELTHVGAPLDMEQAREDEQYVFDQPEAPLFDPFLEFEEGEESAHCPSVPREGPHPWAVAWSADDSGTVDNGEYQVGAAAGGCSGRGTAPGTPRN